MTKSKPKKNRKLVSLNELSKSIRVTSPAVWAVVVVVAAIIAAGVLWSFLGSLPQKVNVNGIFINEGGVESVFTGQAGVVTDLYVDVGDEVNAGTPIATLYDDTSSWAVTNLEERILAVKAVTLDSTDDVITADNKKLIDLKTDLNAANMKVEQTQGTVGSKQRDYNTQKAFVGTLEKRMTEARGNYYAAVQDDLTSYYQAIYNHKNGIYEEAKSRYDSALSTYLDKISSYRGGILELAAAATTQQVYKYQEGVQPVDVTGASSDGINTGSILAPTIRPGDVDDNPRLYYIWNYLYYTESSRDGDGALYVKPVSAYLDELEAAADGPQGGYNVLDDHDTDDMATINALRPWFTQTTIRHGTGTEESLYGLKSYSYGYNVMHVFRMLNLMRGSSFMTAQQSWASLTAAAEELIAARESLDAKKAECDDAKAKYETYILSSSAGSVTAQKLYTEYNTASSEYSTQYNNLLSLGSALRQAKSQLANDKLNVMTEKAKIGDKFYTAQNSILDGLGNELANTRNEFLNAVDKTQIISYGSGVVSNVIVKEGAVVQQGAELVQLTRDVNDKNVITFYVPSSKVGKVKAGMTVDIYPTTVNKYEYGYMRGTVSHVDEYVTGKESMRVALGDETLVKSFMKSGPVIAVTCTLQEDTSTASGYWWSTSRGATVALTRGTLVSGEIVVEQQKPITLLVPWLKDTLDAVGGGANG